MKFRNMSIRARLGLAFGGLALVVLGVSVLALNALADANARFTSYTTGLNARAAVAAHVRAAVDDRAIAARNLVLVSQEADLAIEKAAVTRAHEDVKDSLALLNKMLAQGAGVPEQARQLVGEIDKVEQAYGPVALAIVDLALKGQREQAIARMNNDCRPLLAALVKAANAYAQFTATRTRELEAAAAADYAQQRNLLGALCLAAVAAAMLAGWLITRSITRPLGLAVAAADRIAAGDLGTAVVADATDETGRLLSSLQRMQHSLVDTVGTVRSNADSVSVASREIAQGNNDLSQRTEEQASALQQTAASMEGLNNTVRTNADNARQAGQLAAAASQQAVTGGDVVGQVVQTMKGITHSSDQISEIISVIDGIAFQTNILALNAAVEAARAGEQGRGFAVVAAEVRALAQRSAQAAKEIKVLITDSAKRVEQGSALVDRAGAAMQDLVGSVQRVSHIMGEISAASAAQSESVSQIGMAIHQMDQATQQNAALVEESAAAAASLKSQAEQLVEAVAVFHLEPQPSPAAEPALAPTPLSAEPATPPSVAPARAVMVERRGPHRAANVHRLPQAAAVAKAVASPAMAPKVAAYQAPALPRTGTDDWAAF